MADGDYELRVVLTKALRRIEELEQRQGKDHEPIAVIGMGCRFPGGIDSPPQYWKLLAEGRSAIVDAPASRRHAVRRAGLLERPLELMDADFFGIAPREAVAMDPQQRLVLEVAWEAMEDAALAPGHSERTRAGVYLGVGWPEYQRTLTPEGTRSVDTHTLTGTMSSIVAGRVSYLLGLSGPAIALDTACSSALVAVHQAIRGLRSDECDLALAGGVNLIQSEVTSAALARMGALSPTGRCRPFDAAADGYVRGEGAGVIVLKRLSRARADGDDIRAVIRGSAVNHDGRSMGLTAPNPVAQNELLRAALADAGLDATDIGYIETHGTGTPLGDPIEIEALATVFGARADGSACLLGSVKAQLGHLEAAAGMAGLIKTVLLLQHGVIPRQPEFDILNPRIDLTGTALRVADRDIDWPAGPIPRRAGVSSFGFAGTNAHVVLEEAPPSPAPVPEPGRSYVLALSARTDAALAALTDRYTEFLAGTDLPLADIAATTATGRGHAPVRRAVVARTVREAADLLTMADADSAKRARMAPRVAMLFTGQGAQYMGMGRALYRRYPVFRAEVDRCDRILGELTGGLRVQALLFDSDERMMARTEYAQPALFTVEWACFRLWESWGIRPAAVLGHSLGELVAATAAGALDPEEGLRLAAERGRLMGTTVPGVMAAVFAGPDEFAEVLADPGEPAVVAAINGPHQFVVSGTVAAVRRVRDHAAERGIRTVPLPGDIAFHSPLLDPILDEFTERAARLITSGREPIVPLVSNVTGRPLHGRALDAGYWREHARATVRFGDGLRALSELDIDTCLEIGPHPVLLGLGKWLDDHAEIRWLSSMHRAATDDTPILSALAELYRAGAEITWTEVMPASARRRTGLPTYPFQRHRYAPTIEPENGIDSARTYLSGHRFRGRVVAPAAYLVWSALRAAGGVTGRELTDGVIVRPVTPGEAAHPTVVPDGDGRVDIEFGSGSAHMSAVPARTAELGGSAESERSTGSKRLPESGRAEADAFYRRCAAGGLELGSAFRWITHLSRYEGRVTANLARPATLADNPEAAMVCLLDAAVQTGLVSNLGPVGMRLPTGLGRVRVYREDAPAVARAEAVRTGATARILLLDENGSVIAELDEVRYADPGEPAVAVSGAVDPEPATAEVVAEPPAMMAPLDDTAEVDATTPRSAAPAASGLERRALLDLVGAHAAAALGRTDAIPEDAPLRDFGLDSMMAVDLRNSLAAEVGIRLPATLLFNFPTVSALAEEIARLCEQEGTGSATAAITAGAAGYRTNIDPITGSGTAASLAAVPVEPPSSDEPPAEESGRAHRDRSDTSTAAEDLAEAIVVIGMGCRYPGGVRGPDDLWRLLLDGTDAITEVPADRWDVDAYFDPDPDTEGKTYSRWGGFVDGVAEFDAGFFDISPGEARMLDPQQRLLLEVTWEALEHAGYPADRIAGSRTGVFTGLMSNDYAERMARANMAPDAWFGTGNLAAVASGRLSYFLGATGPSLTVDTACSSSLVTVHLAVQSLRRGECDLALAGGATVLLTPSLNIYFARARGLAADGRCKSFDAAADGVVWSDGAATLVLKRLSDAQRDGDRVLAVVRGSAVNSDGRSQGLSAPNGLAQQRVIRAALADAGVAATDIDYVEAHGTGTALGDPIEVDALAEVLAAGRPADRPLWIGAVKSNIGHTQAAAGLANLIKVVEAMRHERIPATLHFRSGNPHVDWDTAGVRVVAEHRAWPRSSRVRRAGVSAFGISGTNAHIVVEEPPVRPHPVPPAPTGTPLLALSAKDTAALRALAARYRDHVAAAPERNPHDICAAANMGRTHFRHRVAIVFETIAQLRTALEQVASGAVTPGSVVGPFSDSDPETVALAQRYVSGAEIDWRAVHPGADRYVVDLPRYPFQRVRYWLDTETPEHPRITATDTETVDIDPALFDGHRLHGVPTAPAAWIYTVLMRATASKVTTHLIDFTLTRPLTVRGPGRARLRTVPDEDDRTVRVELLESRAGADALVAHARLRTDGHPSRGDLPNIPDGSRDNLWQAYYERLAALGLELGPDYRCAVDLLRLGAGETLTTLRIPPTTRIDPAVAVLDACLHTLVLTADPAVSDLYLPASVDTVRGTAPTGRAGESLYCRTRLTEYGGRTITGDITLCDPSGTVLWAAESVCLVTATADPAKVRYPEGDGVEPSAVIPDRGIDRLPHHIAWRSAPEHDIAEPTGHWLVFADGPLGTAIAERITAHGAKPTVVRPNDLPMASDPDAVEVTSVLTRTDPPRGVVFAWTAGPVASRIATVLKLISALVEADEAISVLWLVTAGAQYVVETDRPDPDQALLWGVGRTVAGEHPALGTRLLDVEPGRVPDPTVLSRALFGRSGAQLALRAGELVAAWLVSGAPMADSGHASVVRPHPSGELDRVRIETVPRRAPGPDEVEIAVAAAGVNPADVRAARGMSFDTPERLGAECAGRISAIGARVRGLRVGDPVLAAAGGGLATHVIVDHRMVASLPAALSVEAAATVPLTFTAAWYGLFELGGLRSGDRVFVHAPADALGIAVVQLARHAGAEVTGTVALRDWAARAGYEIAEVGDWRARDFSERARAQAGGVGFDVVFSAITPEFTPVADDIRAPGGRVVRWDPDGSPRPHPPHDLEHFVIDPAAAAPESLGKALRAVVALIDRGLLTVPPHAVYRMAESAAALRAVWRRDHPGRVVVRTTEAETTDDARIVADGSYLVTGGFGGLGAVAARRLVAAGARHLVLVGRRGPDEQGARLVESLRAAGARVVVRQVDVSDRAALARLLHEFGALGLPPLRGVVHCAGVLDDGMITQQSWARFRTVLGPKYTAARHLDELTRGMSLDLFVLYSSVAGILGTPGQANYAAANAALDALARRRHAEGLPASSIAWGPFADIGMTAGRPDITARLERRGLPPLREADAVAVLDRLFASPAPAGGWFADPAVGVFDFVPNLWYRDRSGGLFVESTEQNPVVAGDATTASRIPVGPGTAAVVSPAEPERAVPEDGLRNGSGEREWVEFVRRVILRVLNRDTELDPDRPLHDSGVDSLTGMELRTALMAEAGVALPASLVFDHPTVRDIAGLIRRKLAGRPPSAETGPSPDIAPSAGESVASPSSGVRPVPASPGTTVPSPVAADPSGVYGEDDVVADPSGAHSESDVVTDLSRACGEADMGVDSNRAYGDSDVVVDMNRAHGAAGADTDPIVIVGMACRFPGGVRTPEQFWDLLREGRDAITEVPADRWDIDTFYDPDPAALGTMYTRWGGFVDGVMDFDAEFFGIGAAEARAMDPQQRLLLEVAWEALERSGRAPRTLAGSRTGVFVGQCFREYPGTRISALDPVEVGAYSVTGAAPSVTAGRLAYLLGAHGPALTVDTACSSSLVALQSAWDALRAGRCDQALVGGVNLQLAPETTLGFCRIGALSPDGRCRAFAADANGYVRADGCGVLVVTTLSRARRAGDTVLAVVRGIAVNHDGRSNGLTAPNGPAQRRVVAEALAQAGFPADSVGYVEAHGTGTPLGDPIEVAALADVYGANRTHPLLIGSVKTNIGHTEAAAGMAGVIKAVLSLGHGRIPASLHFDTPNPHIEWGRLPVEVVTDLRDWPTTPGPRRAGVSSFGMSGTNAHVLLEQPPTVTASPRSAAPGVLLLSARTETVLTETVERWVATLSARPDEFADLLHTAAVGRDHGEWRRAVVANSAAEAVERLRAGREPAIAGRVERADAAPKVGLLFTGQGAQYPRMARELFDTEPVFRDTLEHCAATLGPIADGIGLLDALYSDRSDELLRRTAFTQPALFAVEWSLWRLWRSWGLRPAAVMGHSVGEYVAACVAGVLDPTDALELVATRGRLMQGLPAGGAMLAVRAAPEQVCELVDRYEPELSIAGFNSPDQVVVAGHIAVVDRFRAELANAGIRSSALDVSHAFHSALMDPILDDLTAAAAGLEPGEPAIPWISDVTGVPVRAGELDAEYWARHARRPVRFAQGVRSMAELGTGIFLEIGPNPILTALARRTVGDSAIFLASLRRGGGDRTTLLDAVARLFVAGVELEWERICPGRRVVAPTSVFRRRTYRPESASSTRPAGRATDPVRADTAADARPVSAEIPVLVEMPGESTHFTLTLDIERDGYLTDHLVGGRPVVPGAWFVSTIASAARRLTENSPVILDDLVIGSGLELRGTHPVHLRFDPCDTGYTVVLTGRTSGKWTSHVRGRVLVGSPATVPSERVGEPLGRCLERLALAELDRRLTTSGLRYGPAFRRIHEIRVGGHETVVTLTDPPTGRGDDSVHPTLLDAAFQAVYAVLPAEDTPGTWLPVAMDRVVLAATRERIAFGWARLSTCSQRVCLAEVRLFDAAGDPVVWVQGLRIVRTTEAPAVAIDTPRRSEGDARIGHYRTVWRAVDAAIPDRADGHWLVISGPDSFGSAIAAELRARGAQVSVAQVGDGFAVEPGERFRVDLGSPAAVRALLTAVTNSPTPLRGIVAVPTATEPTPDLPASAESAVLAALHLVQAAVDGPPVWLLTRDAHRIDPTDPVSPVGTALWGFARNAQSEYRDSCRIIDLSRATTAMRIVDELTARRTHPQLALRDGRRLVPRLAPITEPDPVGPASAIPPEELEGTVVLTGGLGGLGLRVARRLVDRGARDLVLVSRTAPEGRAAAVLDELRVRARIEVRTADVADRAALAAVLEWIARRMPPLRGVVHLAGVRDDGVLTDQNAERLRRVLAPKLRGAWYLHELTARLPLRFFILFSSASGVVGLPGQTGYGAANAFLDGVAETRVAAGLPGTSIAWGPWAGAGMVERLTETDIRRLTARGYGLLPADAATDTLDRALTGAVAGAFTALVLDTAAVGASGSVPDVLRDLVSADPVTAPVADSGDDYAARMEALVRRCLGLAPDAGLDRPLHELGLDSVAAVEIRDELSRSSGHRLPSTLAFEYPTPRAVLDYLLRLGPPADPPGAAPAAPVTSTDESAPASWSATHNGRRIDIESGHPLRLESIGDRPTPEVTMPNRDNGAASLVSDDRARTAVPAPTSASRRPDPVSERGDGDIAIIGMSGRYPGAPDLDAYWRVLIEGRDCITEIPAERWDHARYFHPDRHHPHTAYTKWGGFLDDVDCFDPLFFAISPREAEVMDPQERLFLQTAWAALENAGYSRTEPARIGLRPEDAGVFVGVMWGTYQLFGAEESRLGRGTLPASTFWSIPNRVSHALDFQGPSMAVDTACSSSLSAVHLACQSLRTGECRLAIVGGVNLSLHPYKFVALSQGQFASSDGRCRSFGAGGDGYVPGEGVGALVLRPLAEAEAAGDTIHAVIKGTAVNHGGRVNGFTVPNPSVQAAVIRRALRSGGVDPATVSYIEAHGTGTALGDPIEIAGLAQVFGNVAGEVPVGSVKSNIGHLEAAAGVAAITKVLLQLRHGCIAPSLHGVPANPNIDFARTPFRVPDRPLPWSSGDRPRRATVSSFGAGGSNANLVLEEYLDRRPATHRPGPQVIPISAQNPQRLADYVAALDRHLAEHDPNPADLAYTMQVGRLPAATRVAFVAENIDELRAGLRAWLDGAPEARESTRAAADPRVAEWLAGGTVDWAEIRGVDACRRIPLPTYPFARERYWIPEVESGPRPTAAASDHPDARTATISVGHGAATAAAESSRRVLAPVWRATQATTGQLSSRTLVLHAEHTPEPILDAVAAAIGGRARMVRVPETRTTISRPSAGEPDRDDFTVGADLGRLLITRHPDTDCVVDICDLVPTSGNRVATDLGRIGLYQGLLDARSTALVLLHLSAGRPGVDGPETAPLGGLAAALAEEIREVTTRTVELHEERAVALADPTRLVRILGAEYADAASGAVRVRYRGSTRETLELAAIPPSNGLVVDPSRTYVVTGGTRGLGAEFAAALVTRGARRLAILAREPLPPESEWVELAATDGPYAVKVRRLLALRERGVRILTHFGPLTDTGALTTFFHRVRAELGPIGGVLHCAGAVSAESPAFLRKTGAGVAAVLEPKIPGTEVLADVLADDRPDFFVLFSSVSAVLPGLAVGLSDYAMANAHLDRFAEAQHARGRTWFRSVNWPSFRDTGFGAAETAAYRATGLPTLTAAEGFDLLDAVLGLPDAPVALPYLGAPLRLSPHATTTPPPPRVEPAAETAPTGRVPVRDRAYTDLLAIFSDELKLPPERFDGDRRFEEYGADSVLVASAVRRIEHLVGEPFDPALVLEYPTLDELAALLRDRYPDRFGGDDTTVAPSAHPVPAEPDSNPGNSRPDTEGAAARSLPEADAPAATPSAPPVGARSMTNGSAAVSGSAPITGRRPVEPIAVVGIGCRLPGGDDPAAFWRMLATGGFPVREVDPARWDPTRYYHPAGGPGLTNSKWGGFVDGIDLFDPGFFGISDEAALQMDPLQRLLLETSVLAVADAGYRRDELAGRRIGVYAGSRAANYFDRIPVADRHTIVGIGQNFIAARISDHFDWHAGNLVLDSACSSSLVSVHLACQALRAGELDAALAGGVEVLLDETPFVTLAAAGVLSPHGRCATFDRSADGFVPGEGAALLLLKRLDDALADGDRIYAVLRGSAIGNDGHTMGITTPNMSAQIEVITAALDTAGISPRELSYVEAHGTGTAIGDPIELKALATVLGDRTGGLPCAVGSVKTNIGHLLSAAGIAGAVKTVLAVHHGALPPSLHSPNLNPRFAFAGSPLVVNRELRPWHTEDGRPRVAGVSSFGFGGTNAHLIVEQAPTGHIPTRPALPAPVFHKRRFMLPKSRPDTSASSSVPPSTTTVTAPVPVSPMPAMLRLEPLP